MAMQNHVNDPLYFFEAVEEFAFNFVWYSARDIELDDYGRKVTKYDVLEIRGSLQSQGTSLKQDFGGNTENMRYQFYCMGKYRIHIGDFIVYKHRYLHVDSVRDYDEWGVRSCELTMVNLNNYKDLQEAVKYLNGESVV